MPQPVLYDPDPRLPSPASPFAIAPQRTLLCRIHLSYFTRTVLWLDGFLLSHLTFSRPIYAFQGLVQMSPLCETMPDFLLIVTSFLCSHSSWYISSIIRLIKQYSDRCSCVLKILNKLLFTLSNFRT